MRIVIDLQGAQSESRFHGIGRYSLAISREIARNNRGHEIWLLLNTAFAEQAAELRALFADDVPAERVLTFAPPANIEYFAEPAPPRRTAAAAIRDHVLRSVDPDCVLVTSLVEPLGSDALATSLDPALEARSAPIVYDLIPWIRPDQYLQDPVTRVYYASKLREMERAGLLLCISDSSRREALQHLDIPAASAVSISAAADEAFSPGPRASTERLSGLGVTKPFVMYSPSGYDARKNIEGLIAAFGQLPIELRSTHQLVITSAFKDHSLERLRSAERQAGLAAGELVLTGYVSDSDLIALYRSTELFVYPSLHEGFGLPALEAMSCGAPVIGSNTTSVPEIIGDPDAMFDPAEPVEIARAIARTLPDDQRRKELSAAGIARAAEFSWERSASRALDAIEARFPVSASEPEVPTGRQRLALVSPLPPQRTGIAGYTSDLLPALCDLFDVTLISESVPADGLESRTPEWLRTHADEFDHVVYQMGNSTFHEFMLPLMRAVPGVVVLHDFFLSGMLHASQPRSDEWQRAMADSHGDVLFRPGADANLVQTYPANRSVLNAAEGVIVHSAHARDLVAQWYGPCPDLDVAVVPMVRRAPADLDRATARDQLGIGPDAKLVCTFGMVAHTKCDRELLDAWLVSAAAADPTAELHFVGGAPDQRYTDALRASIAKHDLTGRVTITDWISPETYAAYLAAADVAVQLRTGTRGETSASAYDCLNHRIPTIVNAHGSNAEMPADAVRMISDTFTAHELAAAIDTLLADDAARAALGSAAGDLAARDHRPEACAAAYADFLRHVFLGRRSRRSSVLRTIARELAGTAPSVRIDIAQAVGQSIKPPVTPRHVLVDVTGVADWPDAATADAWVRGAPQSVRVQFVRAVGGRITLAEGHPRPARAAGTTPADLRPGDLLLVSSAESAADPALRGAYRSAQGFGARLAVVLDSADHMIGALELLGPLDAGAFCDVSAVDAAERASDQRVSVRGTAGDVRAAAVDHLVNEAAR